MQREVAGLILFGSAWGSFQLDRLPFPLDHYHYDCFHLRRRRFRRTRPRHEGRGAASPLGQSRGGGPRGVGDRSRPTRPRWRPRIRHRCRCRLHLQEGLEYEAVSEFKHWEKVKECNFGVLLVSQFTLYGILKGNKPDFHVAMPPHKAKPFYESLVEKFCKAYTSDAVKDGVFGAMMKVNLVNDGPVTMQLDSSQSHVGASLEEGEQGDLPL